MSNILFLYDNLLDIAALTESSEATGFPVENIQHPFRSKVWRTEDATAGTANVVIDHGAAKAVNCIALANYNWASAPGTLDLEFNATDAWEDPSPSETEALTWAANPTANGNPGIIVKTFASKSYQYNRLNVVYSPGATPTDWDLGRVFVGTYFEPAKNRLAGGIEQEFIDASYVSRTAEGQEHSDEIPIYREKRFSFILETQAQWELFQKMFNSVGIFKDFFLAINYDNEPDEMTWYGKFASIPEMSRIPVSYFRLDCAFRESR